MWVTVEAELVMDVAADAQGGLWQTWHPTGRWRHRLGPVPLPWIRTN